MAPSKQVKVMELCKVAPPPGSVAPASLPPTFFDLFFLPLPPPQLLYFYDFPHPLTQFTYALLPRIKHSLSLTLRHFYPLAGSLSWPLGSPKPMLHYVEGNAVSLTIAESDDDFHRLSGNQVRDANESHPLVPQLSVTGSVVPLLALQATVFPNSGICFGIALHHSVVDAKTTIHFMKSWASICKLGEASLPTESLPIYDRTLIKDPKGIEKIFLSQLVKFFHSETDSHESGERRLKVVDFMSPPKVVRATFQLNGDNVARLRGRIWAMRKKQEQLPQPRLSTFTVVCAYTWVCLVQAGNERFRFLINVDCRSRLDPPLPATYFGNCIGTRIVNAERADLLRHDALAIAATLIDETTKRLENGVLDDAELWLSRLLSAGSSAPKIAVAGSNRLGFYDADFGWGRPKKVELTSNDRTGAIFITENPNGDGGAEISLTLKKGEMDAFASVFVNGLRATGTEFNPSRL
ncbi:PREDICTED: anthocyanin 5-aromatic acyltransferase-like [Nelumbo nucifera]|uniref:Anthocyanin 5-aromatic acyltransferase-like n=2 Tax=Nelumbo nucifera TaxID=4432 RepID=A0A1U8ASH9_NELNU|nr:PREDICTED: anthocyanin 5-aromatic acyltransferase-like [Nelumbo nucifera]DAD29857.1 TPA_asm: hypothetical protein HUJ06_031325 [Nelumbo nucifera]